MSSRLTSQAVRAVPFVDAFVSVADWMPVQAGLNLATRCPQPINHLSESTRCRRDALDD